MITSTRLKELLTLNLNDERMTSSVLFIKNLIAREIHGSGIEQYRIKNLVTGEWVASIEEFIAGLDETQLEMRYPYEGERLQTDRVTGFLVNLNHYEVVWGPTGLSDRPFSGRFDFDSQVRFQFMLIYMNDGDETLPLKISYVKLVGK